MAAHSTDHSVAVSSDTDMAAASPKDTRSIERVAASEKPQQADSDGVDKALEPRNDPDAQTTVTDFLDFTEYLPSDVIRSLTLIGKLDETYTEASRKVHDLTTTWSQLPSLPADKKPSPLQLRADISESLDQAVNSRMYAHDEAVRMSENVNRHYHKAKVLLSKLRDMLDHYPSEEPKSPLLPKSPTRVRAKATLGEDGKRIRRHRIPKVTVPGEVLAPQEIEYDTDSGGDDVSTDDDSDIYATGRRTPMMPRIKLIPKSHKLGSRLARPITYSSAALTAAAAANAAALLNPPPENAVIGSADAPWLQLTQYELAKLRKRMKKNATWTPSETMVARELKQLGRGPDEYREAKRKAEAEGIEFTAAVPSLVTDGESGTPQLPAGAISVEAFEGDDKPMSNRGMKLNEAKKLKREALAKLAAEEAEESARKMAHAAKMFMGSPEREKAAGKRKRGDEDEEVKDARDDADEGAGERSETPPRPNAKRSRVETPVLPPLPGLVTPGGTVVAQAETPVPIPVPPRGTSRSAASPTPSATNVTTTIAVKPPAQTPVPLPRTDRRKSTTPIMPPTFEPYTRRETRGAAQKSPEESSRPQRAASRGLTPRPASRGKSTSSAPEAATARQTTRRAKRPAPGVVSTTVSGGSSAVGKRKAATKKKARARKGKEEDVDVDVEMEEVDDDGNPIDPNEPRYCLCNRVSFGTMIQCDSMDCKQEWFHLECVGLSDIPARTTKWYCPDCRKALNLGEKGEVSARGVKK